VSAIAYPAFFAPPERGDPRLTSDSWWQVGDEQRVIEQARQEREAIEDERAKREFYAGR
jgi:hypothetical protein